MMRTVKVLIASAILISVTGCGGGGGGSDLTPPTPPPPPPAPPPNSSPPPASIDDIVLDAESSGVIETFDRTDSLGGVDADDDGIRDDIAAYIDSFELSSARASAATQLARSLQTGMTIDVQNPQAVQEAAVSLRRAVACVAERSPDPLSISTLVRALEAATANTRQRTDQYIAFNKALGGDVLRLPDTSACNS
ncbi:MAG: hypothetical protein AAF515_03410 [Pseudomonadota bacterium]